MMVRPTGQLARRAALEGDDEDVVVSVFQVAAPVEVEALSVSSTSDVYDVHLGFRWRALKWLEPFAGLRQTHYSHVGLDLRPTAVSLTEGPNGVEFQLSGVQNIHVDAVAQIRKSVTYEGFYFGVTFRLY